MMKTSVLKFAIVVCASLAMLTSCEYDIVIPEKIPPPPLNDTISFAQDIIPVFNKNCNASCHKTGAIPPDLSPANAFVSLTADNYVVAGDPDNSELYTICTPGASMATYISAEELNLIYRWIYAGAKND